MAKETKSAATDDRERNIAVAVQTIERQFGKGSIMRLKEGESVVADIGVIPTGSLTLDTALGIGGYPKGRVVEIYGQESSGKTTLALLAIAEAQKAGGLAVFIDAEHALDVNYARKLGVSIDDLLLAQPDTGEQALEIAETLVRTNAVDIVVVDSVAALVPKAELEGDMGDSHVGLQARLMSQALRKLAGVLSKSKTCMVFINQIRMKIGVMYGNPETTTGGNALKFYSSVRLEVRRGQALKEGDGSSSGVRTRVKVVKNKMAPPFKEAEFDLIYGQGINRLGELIDLASQAGVVDKAGSWFSFNGERLGQGREQSMATLSEKPELLAQVENGVLEKYGIAARAIVSK
ncbi:MAG: recombinase RecA [Myxococcota bacterium]|jgi:recombination protein RecA|nr:MAG: recombinase A [Deltaproteobacteria bacterium ADurb.Bin058]HOE82395.1 recombinase RecA [Myxococcota bacterium]HON24525.1 recombinase RecA [Myxococcota bacterium]HOS61722.1 recombinase RecA [Myxococcota bacterium]HPC90924.1 recombinase RecA [Myxococcota bacterium]